ncbi:MAG: hypothetical protein Fur0032_11230 [Terrimicrobiaceae bacterium]
MVVRSHWRTSMLPPVAFLKPSGGPLVDVAGAYFPAWFACLLVGLAGVWLVSWLAGRSGWSVLLRPSVLMLPSVFLIFSCGLWLLIFSAR